MIETPITHRKKARVMPARGLREHFKARPMRSLESQTSLPAGNGSRGAGSLVIRGAIFLTNLDKL